MTGPTQIIVNKVDILEELGIYKLIEFDKELKFNDWNDMSKYISEELVQKGVHSIWFSRDPEEIM